MLGFRLRQEHKHGLDYKQKLQLKQLLQLQQTLRHPEYPYVIQGLPGMQRADALLKERGGSGILIGGLAERVWNQRTKPEHLSQHKDVDVLVLDDIDLDRFEGGIDWWMPNTEKYDVTGEYSTTYGQELTSYHNGNRAVLAFGADKQGDVQPGLHILSRNEVISMRQHEMEAIADPRVYDSEVIDAYVEKLERNIKTTLPKWIKDEFAGQIMTDVTNPGGHVFIKGFDHAEYRAIRGETTPEK